MKVLIFYLFFLSFSVSAYDYEQCVEKSANNTSMPFDAQGNFIEECAPDTLFTWQSKKDVYRWASKSNDENLLPINKEIYFWRSPVGTFAYGDMSVRVKLSPDVEFIQIRRHERDCKALNKEYSDRSVVYVAYLGSIEASEYILCNDNAVDSWSYGTEYHLQEIKAEIQYVDCIHRDFSQMDRYVNSQDATSESNKDKKFGFSLDQNRISFLAFAAPWTDETLQNHVRNIELIVQEGEGHIFESTKAREAKRDHFSTQSGYYFPFNHDSNH